MQTEFNQLSFDRLIGKEVNVKVVDIGANPIDGAPPYAGMLASGHASVVGFEPNPAALAKLESAKGPRECYLPHAVGDGRRQTLHVCAAPGMTSLLEPDPQVLNLLHGFPQWGRVIEKVEVDTVRLSNVPHALGADVIKIDIQGAELNVLGHAGPVLDTVSVIHTEVEFMPLYKGQPLFSDIDMFLREQGFAFHRFFPIVSRMIQPMTIGGDVYAGLSQAVWADAIFIRDLRSLQRLPDQMLFNMAAVLHDCYHSYDVVMHVLTVLDARNGTAFAGAYLTGLQRSAMASPIPRVA